MKLPFSNLFQSQPAPQAAASETSLVKPMTLNGYILEALQACGEDPTISRATEIHGKLAMAGYKGEDIRSERLLEAVNTLLSNEARTVSGDAAIIQAVCSGQGFKLTWDQVEDNLILSASILRQGTNLTVSAKTLRLIDQGHHDEGNCTLIFTMGYPFKGSRTDRPISAVHIDELTSTCWGNTKRKGLSSFLANLAVQVLQLTEHPDTGITGLATDFNNDADEDRGRRISLWKSIGLQMDYAVEQAYLNRETGEVHMRGTIASLRSSPTARRVCGVFEPRPLLSEFRSPRIESVREQNSSATPAEQAPEP